MCNKDTTSLLWINMPSESDISKTKSVIIFYAYPGS